MALRDIIPKTSHILSFAIPVPASTARDLHYPDKAQLRADILAMCEWGMSYREIACVVGLHFTRVWQILNQDTPK